MTVPRTMGPSFDRVLAAAQGGNGTAYERIYNAYAAPVTGFALGRGAEDPESIAQDVMLRVFENLASFSGNESAFESWVFSIARNRLIDAHRAAKRRPESDGMADIPHGRSPAAEADAMDRLAQSDTARQLSILTEEQREVVALRMVADLSLEQVSCIVDRPVSAVKALQRRGLRRLQKEILSKVVS